MPPSRSSIYRRRRLVVGILTVLLLTAGIYTPAALLAPLPAATASVVQTLPETPPAANLDWPAYGENAIGAVGFDGILASSGEQAAVPIASLTKVITALVVLDQKPLGAGEDGPLVTFTTEDESARIAIVAQLGLVQPAEVGSSLSQRDLLEGALVASANNYAAALARWAFGGDAEFLAAATAWLDENNLTDTTVADAMGLSARSTSSPADLIEIGKLALADPTVSEIVSAKRVDVAGIGALANRNLLIGTPGFRGIKTGTLDAAGKCLLWAVDVPVGNRTVTVVGVFLDGPDHPRLAADVLTLVAGVRAGFHEISLATAGQSFGSIETAWGSAARVVSAEDASVIVWGDTPVTAEVRTQPIRTGATGTRVGRAHFLVGDDEIRVPLELDSELEAADWWWRLSNPELLFG